MEKLEHFIDKVKLSKFEEKIAKKVDLFFYDLFENDLKGITWEDMHFLTGNILIFLTHNISKVLFIDDLQSMGFFIDQIMVFAKKDLLKSLKYKNKNSSKVKH